MCWCEPQFVLHRDMNYIRYNTYKLRHIRHIPNTIHTCMHTCKHQIQYMHRCDTCTHSCIHQMHCTHSINIIVQQMRCIHQIQYIHHIYIHQIRYIQTCNCDIQIIHQIRYDAYKHQIRYRYTSNTIHTCIYTYIRCDT